MTQTYQTETVLYGTAKDPSGIQSIQISGGSLNQAVACRPGDGYYELRVSLAIGDNPFTVTATDTLGNAQVRHLTVTRLEQPDLVITSVIAPASGGYFQPIHLDDTVCNIGPGASPGSGSIAWYQLVVKSPITRRGEIMRKIINQRDRQPDPEVLQGFKDLLSIYSPSCVVADSQERAGVMRSYLRPIDRRRFVGPATTLRLEQGNQVDCLDALVVAQAGDVVVVDAAGETETSIWGGLMSGLCLMRGVVGAVVDGGIRDIDETRDLRFSNI